METTAQEGGLPLWLTNFGPLPVTILAMPARIGPKKPVRVFLARWREHEGLSQEQLGGRIQPPVDKGTVSRWENAAPGKISTGVVAAYAEALGRNFLDMYRMPDEGPSLDGLASGLDPEVRKRAVDVIIALAGRRAG